MVFCGYSSSSTNNTDCHDIAEILLTVALNNITPTPFFELRLLITPFVIFKLFKIKLLAEYKLGGYHISKLITIITEDFHPTILILLAHYIFFLNLSPGLDQVQRCGGLLDRMVIWDIFLVADVVKTTGALGSVNYFIGWLNILPDIFIFAEFGK